MQHFGLYFDEWNERGLGRMPSNVLDKVTQRAGINAIFDDAVRLKKEKGIKPSQDRTLETPSLRKAMLAGIMAAVKEFELKNLSIQ
jgi:hypothetical protein